MENENESNWSVSSREWFVEIDRFQDESLENVRGWFCKGFIFTSLQVKGTFLRIKENL